MDHDQPEESNDQTEMELGRVARFLHFASEGNVVGVGGMIDEGMPVDAVDYDDRSALHLAASEGHANVVKLLLEKGAYHSPMDRWGFTPLGDAYRLDYAEICKILKAGGGRTWGDGEPAPPQYTFDATPLSGFVGKIGVSRGRVRKDRENLLKLQAETAPLLYWASRGNIDEVRWMVDNGVDVNCKDYDQRTALHLAACENHLPIVQLLLATEKCEVNPVDRRMSTPLADAQRYGYWEVAKLLAAKGGLIHPVELQATVVRPVPDVDLLTEELIARLTREFRSDMIQLLKDNAERNKLDMIQVMKDNVERDQLRSYDESYEQLSPVWKWLSTPLNA